MALYSCNLLYASVPIVACAMKSASVLNLSSDSCRNEMQPYLCVHMCTDMCIDTSVPFRTVLTGDFQRCPDACMAAWPVHMPVRPSKYMF